MNLNFPLEFDHKGRTATTDNDDHIHDLIEQVLFTSPGERVNRPTFGCNLLQLIFAPNCDGLAAATQAAVQGALQQYLAELIQVNAVEINNRDAYLQVTVRYTVLRTQQPVVAQFERGGL